MESVAALERRLSAVAGYERPRIDLEQYATPADIAARVVHHADLQGDLAGRLVVDLGCGPGILAIGCAFRHPRRVVGLDLDTRALDIARRNEARVSPPQSIAWMHADATQPPVRADLGATAFMNPPFGAQRENVHADRAFLSAAARIASVSYSFHNAGSRAFLEAFAEDHGGTVTEAYAVTFDLAKQYVFHDAEVVEIDVEWVRIDWREADEEPRR